jgi:hypothetical protein
MKKYDIVIVSHEIDFYKIKFVIEKIEKNLKNFEEIHLILSEREEYLDKEIIEKLTSKPIFYHKESEILKIDKNKIKYRPNWIYQMLLKFFQNVTKNDNFLAMESDAVINKPLEFFNEDKTIFYLGNDQHHKPYFNFSEKLIGVGREYDYSFISDIIMYDKKILKEILIKSGCNDSNEFLSLIYNIIDSENYPAENELYGNYCYKYHRDDFEMRKFNNVYSGRHHHWSDEEIRYFIDSNPNADVVSFATYK